MKPEFYHRQRTIEGEAVHSVLLDMGDAHIIMLLGLLCQGANAPIHQVIGRKAKLESLQTALHARAEVVGLFKRLAEDVRLAIEPNHAPTCES